jgi:hypothetical protein
MGRAAFLAVLSLFDFITSITLLNLDINAVLNSKSQTLIASVFVIQFI